MVALRVASTDLYGEHSRVKSEITDAGSTRTLRIVPA